MVLYTPNPAPTALLGLPGFASSGQVNGSESQCGPCLAAAQSLMLTAIPLGGFIPYPSLCLYFSSSFMVLGGSLDTPSTPWPAQLPPLSSKIIEISHP
jgi:hypothetical protein